ncbi:TetR/AcrR family transcriptional regulator [Solitalea koreensis]|uniref:Transcriptional regulator, TetR family n=1 Tax=Solitalea koreensis TaxID=543615 RepID=A0A521E3P6_9SPHI|nr:TetR/AcrR family transcriptional regulator [Solitalea koreensis]SMO77770.1 transcriptional regulator, TetR family [Solitalea koreensis]
MEKEELKERILEATFLLFRSYGVKSITMDDIAKHLAMSKKTIYQYFKDKDDLVIQLMQRLLADNQKQMDDCCEKADNPIHEVIMILAQMEKMMRPMNPTMFYDMQKYHPTAWGLFEQYKNVCVYEKLHKNLIAGVEQGLYRKGMNLEILTTMRMMQVTHVFNPLYYSPDKFNITDVMHQLTDHFLHGVTTLKGHKLINKYLQLTEEE